MRHTAATMGPTAGNDGQDRALDHSYAFLLGDEDTCPSTAILSGMDETDYGSSATDHLGTLTFSKNNYRGVHKWGAFEKQAKAGMMFAADPDSDWPYVFQALHDGVYGEFPAEGSDNEDWKSMGEGSPIINDLFLRQQKLYTWDERNDPKVNPGDFFEYDNPVNGDTEFFMLKQEAPGPFPTNKSDDADWHYVGRYPLKDDSFFPLLSPYHFNKDNPHGIKGSLYVDNTQKAYFILRTDDNYASFPNKGEDNDSWRYVGEHA